MQEPSSSSAFILKFVAKESVQPCCFEHEVKINGKLVVDELSLLDGTKGIDVEFTVATGVIAGIATYKKITVRNGLIVSVERSVLPV